jgi:hypothetical protein
MATASKTSTRDTSTYECTVPFAAEIDGTPRAVRHGEIVAADDPALTAAPQYFCPVAKPHAERPSVSNFIRPSETTVAPPRKPDGWRRGQSGD